MFVYSLHILRSSCVHGKIETAFRNEEIYYNLINVVYNDATSKNLNNRILRMNSTQFCWISTNVQIYGTV